VKPFWIVFSISDSSMGLLKSEARSPAAKARARLVPATAE
jgi:hypothetical protein